MPAQGEEVRKPTSLNSSSDYNKIRDMIESFEKSEEEMEDSNNDTYDQDRMPPHNPDRDQYGNCIPSSPLFEPGRNTDEVNEQECE